MGEGGRVASDGGAPARHLEVAVPDELAGQRLDRVLAALLNDISRARIQRLIAAGGVAVDGAPAAKPSLAVEAGQALSVALPEEDVARRPRPQPLDLAVLYEDDDIAAIDKPAGLVVHAGAGAHAVTLVDALLHRYGDGLSRLGGEDRPGIVHRLDKGTSGVIVIARNDDAHRALARQFAARSVEKEYLALVYGCPREESGTVDVAIGRDRADRTKVSSRTNRPRAAHTGWTRAEELGAFALLRVTPRSGRMHQVRVHLAAIGHPCIGDPKYSGARWRSIPDAPLRRLAKGLGRPALHSHRLRLDHPGNGSRLELVSPLPVDLESLLEALRRARDEA